MRNLSRRTQIALVAVVAIVLIAGAALFYTGSLIAREAVCIARTGVQPNGALLRDDARFSAFAERVHAGALTSMINQFDTETGLFTYQENPNGELSLANNDIRQLLASRNLALASREDPELVALHRQNLDTIMEEWYHEENGRGYVFVDEKSKLGANALLVRLLVASPHYAEYEREAAALVRGIESLVQPDGSFVPWYKEPSYEYDADYLLTFYSGEALLGLLEYAEKADDARVFSLARRVQDFYIDEYVTRIDENYYPAYVPWHTQSLAKLYAQTDERTYADAIFTMNDRVLELQDTEEFVGRFYNPETPQYGSPHGSSDAVYTEGLAYAYEVALAEGDTSPAEAYKRAVIFGVHNLERLQYTPRFWIPDTVDFKERLEGGVMTHVCNRSVRIDTTAHTLDALTKIMALWSAE